MKLRHLANGRTEYSNDHRLHGRARWLANKRPLMDRTAYGIDWYLPELRTCRSDLISMEVTATYRTLNDSGTCAEDPREFTIARLIPILDRLTRLPSAS